jgi:DNA-binding NarL/FixJ family response regulator
MVERKRHYPPAHIPHMTAPERDAKIVELANKGWSLSKIGRAVGMTHGGVRFALDRILEGRPGRDPRA